MIDFRLDGKVAVVTGGGRGIGRACALAMVEAGAEVIVVGRTRSDLEDTVREMEARGGLARLGVCDVTDRRQVAELFEGLGALDVLVNNAGTNNSEAFLEVSDAGLDGLVGLNVKAAFVVAQAAARRMVASERRGSIINMSSQLGHVGFPGRTIYCMTKHAIEGLTKAMALELAPFGIKVNAVAPTFVVTPMTASLVERPGFREEMLKRIPAGRLGAVDDVAGACVFLASPAASLITGTSLRVDGGWTAQ